MADDAATLGRVRVRLGPVPAADDALVAEAVAGVSDRLRLRVGASELPAEAQSVVVDASVKVIRRMWYEGVSSESDGQAGTVTTSFFDDVLAEYAEEIAGLRSMVAATKADRRSRVRLL